MTRSIVTVTPKEAAELAHQLDYAAKNGERTRFWIDTDGVKIAVGPYVWTPGYGTPVE